MHLNNAPVKKDGMEFPAILPTAHYETTAIEMDTVLCQKYVLVIQDTWARIVTIAQPIIVLLIMNAFSAQLATTGGFVMTKLYVTVQKTMQVQDAKNAGKKSSYILRCIM